jgi:hypothetical protein
VRKGLSNCRDAAIASRALLGKTPRLVCADVKRIRKWLSKAGFSDTFAGFIEMPFAMGLHNA